MEKNIERRACSLPGSELRAVSDSSRTVRGFAIIYNARSLPIRDKGTPFIEQILPGAFNESIRSEDVLAFAQHDPTAILGRVSAGTLELQDHHQGVEATISMPDTTVGRDTYTSVKRGDLRHFSFGFVPIEDRWNAAGTERQIVRGHQRGQFFAVINHGSSTASASESGSKSGNIVGGWARHI